MDAIYLRLAKVLDTLPNGFPTVESGVQLQLLKKIFTREQAELFCALKLTFESVKDIATRTGRPMDGLKEQLTEMANRGQLFMISFGEDRFFRIMPWIFGIYELHVGLMDREFSELNEEYEPAFSRQFFSHKPQLMQTLLIDEKIPSLQEALPYERVSIIIENNQAFLANECVCKKQKGQLGHPCHSPLHVCLAVAPVPNAFDNTILPGKVISKDEAYELLRRSEEAGLVHMTMNVQAGHIYICNCCSCCCTVLNAINKLGIPASQVVNSHYHSHIDQEICNGCGICAYKRCPVKAIEETAGAYQTNADCCIGCGLCISACPMKAIQLVHRERSELLTPPLTEGDWFAERGRARGVDFSDFK